MLKRTHLFLLLLVFVCVRQPEPLQRGLERRGRGHGAVQVSGESFGRRGRGSLSPLLLWLLLFRQVLLAAVVILVVVL